MSNEKNADSHHNPGWALWSAALHESGHTIAALSLGITVEYVTLIPEFTDNSYLPMPRCSPPILPPCTPHRDRHGIVEHDDLQRLRGHVVTIVAGWVAEALDADWRQQEVVAPVVPPRPKGPGSDYHYAAELVRALGDSRDDRYIEEVVDAEAEWLLRARWCDVEAVAEAIESRWLQFRARHDTHTEDAWREYVAHAPHYRLVAGDLDQILSRRCRRHPDGDCRGQGRQHHSIVTERRAPRPPARRKPRQRA
ncbi:MAG: hypothetical protein ACLP1X_07090 [Polyangiaceae bacterium]|jgi:hypothetical protein